LEFEAMKLYKDCQLKGRILGIVLRKGTATSREIYEQVQHPSYNAFKSEVNQLKRRGYLTVSNNSKPYLYKLTRQGRLHAHDPYINVKRKRKNNQLRVTATLNNDIRFREIVDVEVKKRLSDMPFPSSHFPPFYPVDPYQQAAYILDELKFKDGEIIRLQNQVQQLTRVQTNIRQPRPPVQQEQQQLKSRIRIRDAPRLKPSENERHVR
jgi:hypothetical protein